MEIQVLVESRNEEVDGLREMAVRRANFATRRLLWLVPRVELTLSNVTGRHGSLKTQCQARLRTNEMGDVVATSIARDWHVAVDDALTRAVRHLKRRWRHA